MGTGTSLGAWNGWRISYVVEASISATLEAVYLVPSKTSSGLTSTLKIRLDNSYSSLFTKVRPISTTPNAKVYADGTFTKVGCLH